MLFAGSQPEQIVNSLSSRIYITACFRAVARHFSVRDNTLYLAALLLPPRGLQSVGTWDGGGSGSTYQPQGKLLQPTCAAAWLPAPLLALPRSSPLRLHLKMKAGRVLLVPFKRDCSCPLFAKVWAVARGKRLGCSHCQVWMLLLFLALSFPGRFPCPAPRRASVRFKN